jgi:hypothetical protein
MSTTMMRKVGLSLVAAVLVSASPARAAIGVPDVVPSATLFQPYFEVDLEDPSGPNTVLTYSNTTATAVLTHVTLYSDLGVPTFAFNVYLTGYDVVTLDLRMLFQGGLVPQSGSAGQDPADNFSPKGNISQDINFASCSGMLPAPKAPANYLEHLRKAHTGQGSPFYSGKCAGTSRGDQIARGYLTIDTVNNCTLRFPGDPGYFMSGGSGDATNQNYLTGRYTFVDKKKKIAHADTMVHVEASAYEPLTKTPGQYTFYGRFVGWSAADNREPLPTAFQARFINGNDPTGVTSDFAAGKSSFFVWRDPQKLVNPFTCGSTPTTFPLSQRQVLIFDQQDNQTALSSSATPFPYAAQKVAITDPALAALPALGFLKADLSNPAGGTATGPASNPYARQGWVTAVHTATKDAVSVTAQPLGFGTHGLIDVSPLDARTCLSATSNAGPCTTIYSWERAARVLFTTTAGGAARFSVQLTQAPTANVTVSVTSSDTAEGLPDVSALTFTPSNWNVPQWVTVEGQAGGEGNKKRYQINLGPAVSTDAAFSGATSLSVDVMSVTP